MSTNDLVAGLDIGSRSIELALLEGERLVDWAKVPTTFDPLWPSAAGSWERRFLGKAVPPDHLEENDGGERYERSGSEQFIRKSQEEHLSGHSL